MTSTLAVLWCFVVHWMLPPSPHRRLLRVAGRHEPALDERLLARLADRRSRLPGQPRTTRLLQMLVADLQAGLIPEMAFRHVIAPDCTSPGALQAAPPTADIRVWRDVALVWSAAAQTGFSLATALQRIHAYALVDQEIAGEVRGHAAAPRFAVALLAFMPVVAWAVVGAGGEKPLDWLLSEPAGWACGACGLALFASAALWIRRMTRAALA